MSDEDYARRLEELMIMGFSDPEIERYMSNYDYPHIDTIKAYRNADTYTKVHRRNPYIGYNPFQFSSSSFGLGSETSGNLLVEHPITHPQFSSIWDRPYGLRSNSSEIRTPYSTMTNFFENSESLSYGASNERPSISILNSLYSLFRNRYLNPVQSDVPIVINENALNSIPIIKYSEYKKENSDCDSSCVICGDDYEETTELRILPCKHYYCKKCIDKWLKEHNHTCPVCKQSCGEHHAVT